MFVVACLLFAAAPPATIFAIATDRRRRRWEGAGLRVTTRQQTCYEHHQRDAISGAAAIATATHQWPNGLLRTEI